MRQVFKEEFMVEQIQQMRCMSGQKNKKEYLTKWQGYPAGQNTWEPEEHFDQCKHMLDSYIQYVKHIKSMGIQHKYSLQGFTYYKKQPLTSYNTTHTHSHSSIANKHIHANINTNKPYLSKYLVQRLMDAHKQQTNQLIIQNEQYKQQWLKVLKNQTTLGDNQQQFYKRLLHHQKEQQIVLCQRLQKKVKIEEEKEKSKKKEEEVEGEEDDKIESVLESFRKDGILSYKVQWCQKRDGSRPADSIIENHVLKTSHPQILLEYYESLTQQKTSHNKSITSNGNNEDSQLTNVFKDMLQQLESKQKD